MSAILSVACGLQRLSPGPVAGGGTFYSGQSEHALNSSFTLNFLLSVFPVLSAAC